MYHFILPLAMFDILCCFISSQAFGFSGLLTNFKPKLKFIADTEGAYLQFSSEFLSPFTEGIAVKLRSMKSRLPCNIFECFKLWVTHSQIRSRIRTPPRKSTAKIIRLLHHR